MLIDLDVGLWATIFSYVSPSDIINFEEINVKYLHVTKSTTFWTILVTCKFPRYSIPFVCDWRELYHELIYFTEVYPNHEILDFEIYRNLFDVPVLKKYSLGTSMFRESRLTLDTFIDSYYKFIWDTDTIKYLFNLTPPNQHELHSVLKILIENFSCINQYEDIIEYILNYRVNIQVSTCHVNKILNDTWRKLSKRNFEIIYEFINKSNNNTLINKLKFMLRYHHNLNQNTIREILDDYPLVITKNDITRLDLISFFVDAIEDMSYSLINEVYLRLKHLLTIQDQQVLTEFAVIEWHESFSAVVEKDINDLDLGEVTQRLLNEVETWGY